MIYAFTGKTGSGKTFNMVKEALPHWLAGRDIYSNTILFFGENGQNGGNIVEYPALFSRYERFKWWLGQKTHKKNQEIPRRGRIIYFEHLTEILEAKNALVLFDEAQALFNARSWESLPLEFQHKLQQHRKHRLDLFATMQNMGTVAIEYRRLVQVWFHFEEVFSLGHDPIKFGVFKRQFKDIDFLYNTVDDLKVPNLKVKMFFIGFWTKRFYDTYFDIGFKRLRTIWITHKDKNVITRKWLMIPKTKSLNNVLRELSTLQSALGLKTYRTSKKT